MFNFKNAKHFEKFIQLTNDNKELRECFDDARDNLEESSQKWLKTLKKTIKSSFTKIRVKKTKISPKLEMLFQEKESIKTKIADKENLEDIEAVAELNDKLNKVTDKIANICAEKNKALVNEYLCVNKDCIKGYSQPKHGI